ncbi:hypothetical protein C2S52_002596 [Perilla frutescens var. hirtella]|nr:hypothetical protein C2S52_002596 [Perilla frutescens var. hirtella]
MQGVSLIRFIVGVVGLPTFWRICKNKSTEEFHPYPYIAAMMNCMLWIFYGLPIVHPDSTLVITINSFGLFMEIVFLSIFFIYTSKNKNRPIIFMFVVGELAFLAAIVVITLLCFDTHTKRSMFTGILCDIFGIIMYASPLSNLMEVIKTKSAEYMPFWLCVAGFSNGIIWFIYAFLKTFDPYIAAGNGIGGMFGLIQLLVWAYYTIKAKNKAEEKSKVKTGDVQLSNVPPA